MTNESEVIAFPLTKEISGPITMDAAAFKANLAAAYSAGAMMMRERAAKCAENAYKRGHLSGHMEEDCEPDTIAARIRAMEIPC